MFSQRFDDAVSGRITPTLASVSSSVRLALAAAAALRLVVAARDDGERQGRGDGACHEGTMLHVLPFLRLTAEWRLSANSKYS